MPSQIDMLTTQTQNHAGPSSARKETGVIVIDVDDDEDMEEGGVVGNGIGHGLDYADAKDDEDAEDEEAEGVEGLGDGGDEGDGEGEGSEEEEEEEDEDDEEDLGGSVSYSV
jgi:hypothetical protein